jgi:hypothetical protein
MADHDSILPRAHAALVELLEAADELGGADGATVYWGPAVDKQADRAVFVGVEEEVDRAREVLRAGGQDAPLDEAWRIQVLVVVRAADGRDLQPTYDGAHEVAAQVERAIRQSNGLGLDGEAGTKVFDVVVGKWIGRFARWDRKRGYQIQMDITGESRIQ